ncbi:MAG TPA: hypothetical protein VF783_04460 [Terriglobales bacterium]
MDAGTKLSGRDLYLARLQRVFDGADKDDNTDSHNSSHDTSVVMAAMPTKLDVSPRD